MACASVAPNNTWQPIMDLGLPRSGTTSFAAASHLLGMRTVHGCTHTLKPIRELGCFFSGTPGGSCIAWKPDEINGSGYRGSVVQKAAAESLSDMPWFMVDVEALRRAYPMLALVCTTRDGDSWAQSMLDHAHGQREVRGAVAGGSAFLWHMYNRLQAVPALKDLAKHKAGRSQDPSVLRPNTLRAFHALHENTTCADVPKLRLGATSAEKWDVFCSSVPSRWRSRCLTIAATTDWPHHYAGASVGRSAGDCHRTSMCPRVRG